MCGQFDAISIAINKQGIDVRDLEGLWNEKTGPF